MDYIIENSFLRVKLNSKGAEITSIQYKDTELIWQGSEPWKRHAPILYPIVGKLKNNEYIYKGNKYSLPQHGFARATEWLCTLQTQTSIEFELTDNENTFIQYPFHFSLIVKYTVINTQLHISFIVFNPDHDPLPFNLGFHPAFNTFSKLNNCYLKIAPEKKFIQRTLLNNGLLSDKKDTLLLNNNTLYLNESLFDNDAIVLEHTLIEEIQLACNDWKYQININSRNCKNWGIWTKKQCSDFVCIEPWMGIADEEITNQNILQKKDIILLSPYESWRWNIQITIHSIE